MIKIYSQMVFSEKQRCVVNFRKITLDKIYFVLIRSYANCMDKIVQIYLISVLQIGL
jgi:hypothetical protein